MISLWGKSSHKYRYQIPPNQEDLILELPDELYYKIFTYLLTPRELATTALVCRRWNTLSEDPRFWKVMFKNLPSVQNPRETARVFYGQFPKELMKAFPFQKNLVNIPILSPKESANIENKIGELRFCTLNFNRKWAIWQDKNQLIHMGIRSYSPEYRDLQQSLDRDTLKTTIEFVHYPESHYFLHIFQYKTPSEWKYRTYNYKGKTPASNYLTYEAYCKICRYIQKMPS